MQRMLELLTTGLLAALLVVLSAALPYICAILATLILAASHARFPAAGQQLSGALDACRRTSLAYTYI